MSLQVNVHYLSEEGPRTIVMLDEIAKGSQLLQEMISEESPGCDSVDIELPKPIDFRTMNQVADFLEGHKGDDFFDRQFRQRDGDTYDYVGFAKLVWAAGYLCIDELESACAKWLDQFIKNNTTKEIERKFKLVPMTSEEREEIVNNKEFSPIFTV